MTTGQIVAVTVLVMLGLGAVGIASFVVYRYKQKFAELAEQKERYEKQYELLVQDNARQAKMLEPHYQAMQQAEKQGAEIIGVTFITRKKQLSITKIGDANIIHFPIRDKGE
ncbi:MAG: hypothetical protein FWD76_03805 [Firmicutes bacterium]|nr:hypothetical protein [Bacillota bacterium]